MRGEGRQGVGERRGWKNGGGRKMRETGDKTKRKKGEGRKESRERERRRGVGEDYPMSSPSLIQGQFLSFWNHKCTSHLCHLKINILFRFQFRDCEGNLFLLLYV